MPEGERKRHVVNRILRHCFSVLSSAISAVINYHNEENRPTTGICVANHTSPIDVLVLMCDTTYSLVSIHACFTFSTFFVFFCLFCYFLAVVFIIITTTFSI